RRVQEAVDRLRVIGTREHRRELVARARILEVAAEGAVDRDEPERLLREQAPELPDHGRAHAVPYEEGALHTRVLHDRFHGAREAFHRVIDRGPVALAMTREIDEKHPRLAVERGYLGTPRRQVAGPAVDEDDGRFRRRV